MSQIRDEAKRQYLRLCKVFVPIPPAESLDEYLDSICEAGNVPTVAELGQRLMDGYPRDEHGLPRVYFPNTAQISFVLAELRKEQAVRESYRPAETWAPGAKLEDWGTEHLAHRNPEGIAKLKQMRDHPELSPIVATARESFKQSAAQRVHAFADRELRRLEDYLGESL